MEDMCGGVGGGGLPRMSKTVGDTRQANFQLLNLSTWREILAEMML